MKNKNSKTNISPSEYSGDEIYIREVFEKYLYHWKWFLLSIILSLSLAYFYLVRTTNTYEVFTTIVIDDGDSGGTSQVSAFGSLGLLGGSKNKLENEIGILQSRRLMEKVVLDLKLNKSFFKPNVKANGEVYKDTEPYNINFLLKDSILYRLDTNFVVQPINNTEYILMDLKGENKKKAVFGKNVFTDFGEINITPKKLKNDLSNEAIMVQLTPIDDVVNGYVSNLSIEEPENINSTLLKIILKDHVREKGIDVLNRLVEVYNEDANDYRAMVTESTDKFIDSRIQDISSELSIADKGIEDYKKQNQLTDMSMEAGLVLQSNSDLESRIVELSSQLRLIDYVIDYINNRPDELIPTNLGLQDQTSSQNAVNYNRLLLERNRILKGSSKLNPTVVTLDEQLKGLRDNFNQSLQTLRSSVTFSLNDTERQAGRLSGRRALAPKQEREIQDIQRRQQIIETLYLYLLQKREENAIKEGAISPNAKVVDRANGNMRPIAPSKKKIYALALLLGLFMPWGILSLIALFNNEITSLEDVTGLINAPVLGDIPKSRTKKLTIISNNDRHSVAEAFRILRTNLNYMLSHVKDRGKVIFVTSTIGGEGKSFIALNLSSVLASTNKKVLLIEVDLRKPKLSKYLNLKKENGLTHFLINDDLSIIDIIQLNETYGFDFICSGEIPPNPSELLMKDRMEELLNYGKRHYDFVIFDTPPVSLVTDTHLISHFADMFIYVVRANYLDKRLLRIPRDLFDKNRLPHMAILINGTDYSKAGYGYGYGYGYGEHYEKKSWWRKKKT